MLQARAISEIIPTFLGNPFDVAPEAWRAAERALAAIDPGAALASLLEAGQVEQATLLLLAVGHRRACDHPTDPGRVFDDALLPATVR